MSGELQGTLPGAHRYIIPTMAAGYGLAASWKLLRSRPAKQMLTGPFKSSGPPTNIKTNNDGHFISSKMYKGKSKAYDPERTRRALRSIWPLSPGRSRSGSTSTTMSGSSYRPSMSGSFRTNRSSGNRLPPTPYRRKRRRKGKKRKRRGKGYKIVRPKIRPSLHGVSETVEHSGIFATGPNNALYLGHGVATNKFWLNLCRALIRKLYRLHGEEIYDWSLGISGTGNFTSLDIIYTIWNDQDTVLIDTTTLAAQSYASVANVLYVRLLALFSEDNQNINLQAITLKETTSGLHLARIVVASCEIQYYIKSSMRIQNASLAGLRGGSTDLADEESDNVTANPLVGKLYCSKSRANGFKPQIVRSVGVGDNVITVANQANGVCSFSVTDTSSSEMRDLYKKPPPARQMRMKGYSYGISPGQIKTFSWVDRRKIKLSALIEKIKTTFTQNVAVQYQNVGQFKMVGLEKKMACSSQENDIVLHWHLQQSYNFVAKSLLGRTNRITDITDPS